MEKLEASYIVGRNAEWRMCFRKQFGISSKGNNIGLSYDRFLQWKHNKNLYMNIHTSFIHDSQKVATTQMPINEWMNKLCVI